MFSGKTPALNRWLTTAQCLGYIACGMMFHYILPRVWRLAFGEGEVPKSLVLGDWHAYAKSKVRRVCQWFSLPDTFTNVAAFVWLIGPAEHLLQKVQANDARGDALRDLISPRTNMFWECCRFYAECVRNPLVVLAPMWRQLEPQGLQSCSVIAFVVLAFILNVGGCLWRDVAMVLDEFPYRLAALTYDCHVSPHPVFDATATRLSSLLNCCLDRGMSLKVKSLMAGDCTSTLGRNAGILSTIRTWSHHSRLCNMCTERLLKGITSPCPPRCAAERLCASGLYRRR